MRTPYPDLSAIARVEAHRKNIYRPAYYVHKWWARRTGSVFRGIALDLLLPEGESIMDAYYRAHDFSDKVILDPFMGGGTTIGEVLRLRCKVVGCDLNPVAWFLVNQSMRAADPEALMTAFDAIEAAVAAEIRGMYATTCSGCGRAAESQYISWVKQVPCGGCGAPTDLALSQVLMADMATKGAGLVLCPCCGHPWRVPAVRDEAECPRCAHRFVPAERRTTNAMYRCDACDFEDKILNAITDEPPDHRMRCLTVWCESCGRLHQAPSEHDLDLYERVQADAERDWDAMHIPRQEIPEGHNTNQARRYGYRCWHQMFNPRQLAGLSALFGAVKEVTDPESRELLALTASAALEFNSLFCGHKGLGTGAIRHVFAHHALIPAKEPLEANLWGIHRSSGGFSTLFRERLLRGRAWAEQPIERRFTGNKAEKVPIEGERLAGRPASSFDELCNDTADMLLLNQSSETLAQVPDESVDLVITDPPYANSVMYSELSDYFYVWLREILKDEYAEFATPHVVDDREAVENPGRGRDLAFYTEVLGRVFAESGRTLKPDGRLAFTFHHSGTGAWRAIEGALKTGGFVVERWWPVFSEMESGVPIRGKANSGGHIDIVFVCAKRGAVMAPAEQDTIGVMRQRLDSRVRLVAADLRALEEASVVQAATWTDAGAQAAA
jgi:putative DNA methylase